MTPIAYENDYGDMCPAARKANSSYRQWYEANEADAEIARLRALVREAFHEGFKAAYCTALTDGEAVAEFDRSAAKKALDP